MRASCSILLALVVAGCGGGGGGGTNPAPTVATVTLTPTTLDTIFAKGAVKLVMAAALDANNVAVPGAVISFNSSNTAVATIASNGSLTTVGEGTTNITASSGGKTSTALVVNVRQRYRKLVATVAASTLGVGDTVTVLVAALDSLSNPIIGLTGATFESSNTSVATVSAAGVVTAVAVGDASIRATLTRANPNDGTFADTIPITVSAFPLDTTVNTVGLTFTPGTVDIRAGGAVTFHNGTATAHSVVWDSPGSPAGISAWSNADRNVVMPNAGTFNYHCGIHGLGMAGTIVVH